METPDVERGSPQGRRDISFGLTSTQRDCLSFIRTYVTANRTAPSVEEIRVHMGLGSKSGVHRTIMALVERGHIRKLPNRARSIELITPEGKTDPTRPLVRVVVSSAGVLKRVERLGEVQVVKRVE